MVAKKDSPSITTDLRKHYVAVPEIIDTASGIIINGKRFRSLIFTTDIAIIMNNDADAVIAVYPFSPHPAIIQGITNVANMPVLAGEAEVLQMDTVRLILLYLPKHTVVLVSY